MNTPRKINSLGQSQGGAVLCLALVFLLLMAMMGRGGLDSSRVALRMLNNDQQRVRALYQAELSQLQAERDIDGWVLDTEPFDFDHRGDAFFKAEANLLDYEHWKLTDTHSPYLVEYLGSRPTPSEPGGEATSTHVYRIIARSQPGFGEEQVIESVYTTELPP
jgi:Tfp pilus assembly protein PilX